ncbi:hypothetical protein [Pseudokordiimonas caeni]|uniref:hypothetical protein n=1 Tax=Pseudokordiimonas caeni TaxID=2997908 RepID=UPI002811DB9B|nr:hypothetical protein [Pseudokordiimonas caeni]
MTSMKSLKSVLLAATAALAIAACGDSSTELASPGNEGPNPGTGGGGGDGGNGGGDGGGSTGDCPTGTTGVTVGTQTHCRLSGTITSDITLTEGNLYQLSGKVVIGVDVGAEGNAGTGDPATLTIEPGVTIYGATKTDLLVVSRGSKIEAEGTSGDPIVFTSGLDLGLASALGITNTRPSYSGPALEEPFTSEWGGLVINGRASINTCNGSGVCEAEGEGDSGLYGGNDDADSSGTMKYVQVKYAGNPITADDELNGIAFQGVGTGTELDYIHVHNGADDAVEFFGGTANIKHLILTGADDDSLDWTQGWRGKAQYVLIMQNPNQPNSDQGIEADNFGDGMDFTPRARPFLSNMTIIGAGDKSTGDIGILLRAGTGARIWNTVVTNFGEECLDIDDDPTYANRDNASTGITIQSTLLACTSGNFDNGAEDGDLESWFLGQARNQVGTSSLSGFINGTQENAVVATNVRTVDTFFDNAGYAGAVRSASTADNWTLGWSYGINDAASCPDGTTAEGTDTCVLEGTLTENVRLIGGFDYVLRGKVVVGEDIGGDGANPSASAARATLTVDAGVTVMGEDLQSYLVVSRGSKLVSNGTKSSPVTFTSANDATANLDTDTSLWGGIVINGRAPINTCNGAGICEAEGEGDSGLYGGNVSDDDSGQILYTVVKYAGNPITSDDELNGIAFQGVGTGTEIDYLQVHNGADDAIEFFGGTVNAKHLVLTGADDDSLDWTQGWTGKAQYVVVVQNPNQPNSDQGIEADNFGDGMDFTPRARPFLSNVSLYGAGDSSIGDIGILLRAGTGARIWNSVAANFGEECLDIDDDPTYANRDNASTGITIQSTLLACVDSGNFDDGAEDADLEAWFLGQTNNVAADTGTVLVAPAGGGKNFITSQSSVTPTNVNAVDSFFDNTDFIGAVKDDANDWTKGWTVWLHQ